MHPRKNPYSLLIEIEKTRDYNERLSLIDRNLERFDSFFIEAFDQAVACAPDGDVKSHLASSRAITLAEITYVHGQRGNIEAARRFAATCLNAYREALYFGGPAGRDRAKKVGSLLNALLADAGEFRGYGLEEEAWQAYWLADHIYGAMDVGGDSATTGQLLTAAVTLEQVGMIEGAEKARQEARARIGDENRFLKEKARAEKIVGPPPSELPPPDIYDGLTLESALRFTSQGVAVDCVKQTRCPKCRGPMKYGLSQSFVVKGGYYRRCELTCQNDKSHPAVTLFRNSLLLPHAQIFAGLGSKLDQEEKERLSKSGSPVTLAPAVSKSAGRSQRPSAAPTKKADKASAANETAKASPAKKANVELPPPAGSIQADTAKLLASYLLKRTPEERARILEPYKEYFKPRPPGPRALLLSGTVFLIISVWISIVPALVCYLTFMWSGLPSPFLRVLFGGAAGLVLFHLCLLVVKRSALQGFIRRDTLFPTDARPAKESRARLYVFTLLGLGAGSAVAFLVGGWAGALTTPLAALNLRVALRRLKEKRTRPGREGSRNGRA